MSKTHERLSSNISNLTANTKQNPAIQLLQLTINKSSEEKECICFHFLQKSQVHLKQYLKYKTVSGAAFLKDNLKSPAVDILSALRPSCARRSAQAPSALRMSPESQDPWSSPVTLLLSQGPALCTVKAALSQHHQHSYPFTTETQQSTAKILVTRFPCSKPGLEGLKSPSEYHCSHAEHSTKTAC